MYDYFEAFSIIPYRLATNGQFATTWTKKTPMHKRTVNIIVTLKYGLEVTKGHRKWYHLKLWYGFLCAFRNYGHICSHFGYIQRQGIA